MSAYSSGSQPVGCDPSGITYQISSVSGLYITIHNSSQNYSYGETVKITLWLWRITTT